DAERGGRLQEFSPVHDVLIVRSCLSNNIRSSPRNWGPRSYLPSKPPWIPACAGMSGWGVSTRTGCVLISLSYAFTQHAFQPRHRRVHDHSQGGEHKHRNPDESDVVGLAGIEDRAPQPVLGGDELADDRAGQSQPD